MTHIACSSPDENFLEKAEKDWHAQVSNARNTLQTKSGKGAEYLGWVKGPRKVLGSDLENISTAADRIQNQSDVLLVIGIGGSYLGAKAVIDALQPFFREEGIEVLFTGFHLSSLEILSVERKLEGKDFSINVISKSGTTTEPALAFRYFRQKLEEKYGTEAASKRIFATTDREKGALRKLAREKGYPTFPVPNDIGGRYSVCTAVGLLPMAVAGIPIEELVQGAELGREQLAVQQPDTSAMRYVCGRLSAYDEGKKIEIFSHYEPALSSLAAWWQQLFGESEGKQHKGLFPVPASFTTDLHSLGQYIQEGERHLLETVLFVRQAPTPLNIPRDSGNLDGLNYLSGKTYHFVNHKAYKATVDAHLEGGVPNLILEMGKLDPVHIGYFLYFMKYCCALSAYALGLNPFDQPGVEAYKQRMFDLLGKPKDV